MGERYPAYIPPALAEVLGMLPHQLYPWWMALREFGVAVPRRYEGEVAAALFFLIPFAVDHPDDWRAAAVAELNRLEGGEPYRPTHVVSPDALLKPLTAAIMALRSYEYGNGSPDLARTTADAGDAALVAAGLLPATLGKE